MRHHHCDRDHVQGFRHMRPWPCAAVRSAARWVAARVDGRTAPDVRRRGTAPRAAQIDRRPAAPRLRPDPRNRIAVGGALCALSRSRLSDHDPASSTWGWRKNRRAKARASSWPLQRPDRRIWRNAPMTSPLRSVASTALARVRRTQRCRPGPACHGQSEAGPSRLSVARGHDTRNPVGSRPHSRRSGRQDRKALNMAKAIAVVPTESGWKYLQQLCKHWAHKHGGGTHRTEGRGDICPKPSP